MKSFEEIVVQVRCAWNAWRTAEVRVGDLHEVHWLQPAGAPRPLLHAYVDCTRLLTGEIPHDCTAANAPHRLLICVLKRFAAPQAYSELTQLAEHHLRTDVVSSLVPRTVFQPDNWGAAHAALPGRRSSRI